MQNTKKIKFTLVPVVVSTMFNLLNAQIKVENQPTHSILTDSLFPRGQKIVNDNFKGTAYLMMLIDSDSINPTSVGNVSFEAGARTKWHSHPGGQILIVIDGVGFYQEKGHPKKILRKGDVIKCPANLPHWHGAGIDTAFVQVAVTNRHLGETVWLQHVTDTEYNGPIKPVYKRK